MLCWYAAMLCCYGHVLKHDAKKSPPRGTLEPKFRLEWAPSSFRAFPSLHMDLSWYKSIWSHKRLYSRRWGALTSRIYRSRCSGIRSTQQFTYYRLYIPCVYGIERVCSMYATLSSVVHVVLNKTRSRFRTKRFTMAAFHNSLALQVHKMGR